MASFGYKDRTKVKQKGPKFKSLIQTPDGRQFPSTVDPQIFPQLDDNAPITVYAIEEKLNEKGKSRPTWVEKRFIKRVVTLVQAPPETIEAQPEPEAEVA